MQPQGQQTARRSASDARRFLKNNVGIALAATATAAVPGSATSASAGTGYSYRGSVVTDVRTAATFDYAAARSPRTSPSAPTAQ
jgi:hypothetical protein